jgi:hypothetical protein
MTESQFYYLTAAFMIYVGICAGKIAEKHGKNPFLYGLGAVISPINFDNSGHLGLRQVRAKGEVTLFVP